MDTAPSRALVACAPRPPTARRCGPLPPRRESRPAVRSSHRSAPRGPGPAPPRSSIAQPNRLAAPVSTGPPWPSPSSSSCGCVRSAQVSAAARPRSAPAAAAGRSCHPGHVDRQVRRWRRAGGDGEYRRRALGHGGAAGVGDYRRLGLGGERRQAGKQLQAKQRGGKAPDEPARAGSARSAAGRFRRRGWPAERAPHETGPTKTQTQTGLGSAQLYRDIRCAAIPDARRQERVRSVRHRQSPRNRSSAPCRGPWR